VDTHTTAGGAAIPCTREAHGRCAICDRINPGSPAYDAAYRRIFHPAEFPGAPPPDVAPDPLPGPAPPPPAIRVMLAGDLMESAAKRLGADRLAKFIGGKLGVDCGCSARRDAINRLDAKLRAYLGLGGTPPRPPDDSGSMSV
jgi:hypothetical protein